MPQRIAVIGAGTIGASWAAYFLAQGFEVSAYDPSPNGEAFARRFIDNAWPTLEKLGARRGGRGPQALHIPCDVRRRPPKARNSCRRAGPNARTSRSSCSPKWMPALPPEAVIATSSSGLLISRVTVKCKHPERCVIGHPFNPPHLIPLVEVVGGEKTSAEAITKAMDFYRDDRQASDPHQERSEGPRRQPLAGGAVARGDTSGRRRRGVGRRCRRGDRLRARPALGADGAASDVSSRRRRRRHDAFHVASRGRPGAGLDGRSRHAAAHAQVQKIIDGVAEEAGSRSIADLQHGATAS